MSIKLYYYIPIAFMFLIHMNYTVNKGVNKPPI